MRWVRVRAGGAGTSCWPPPVPGERSRGRAGGGRRAGRLVPRQTAAAAAPAALPAVWPAHLNHEKIYLLNTYHELPENVNKREGKMCAEYIIKR